MFKFISKWDWSAIDQKLKESKFLSVTFIQALRFLDERTPKQNNRQDAKRHNLSKFSFVSMNLFKRVTTTLFRANKQLGLMINCTYNFLFRFDY
jgi:hypothetical protein